MGARAPARQVFSWTVIHRSQTPGFEADTPYAVVLVELDEAKGVRMIGNLVSCPPDRLAAGLAVEAVFTPAADGAVTLVNWQPTGRQLDHVSAVESLSVVIAGLDPAIHPSSSQGDGCAGQARA